MKMIQTTKEMSDEEFKEWLKAIPCDDKYYYFNGGSSPFGVCKMEKKGIEDRSFEDWFTFGPNHRNSSVATIR